MKCHEQKQQCGLIAKKGVFKVARRYQRNNPGLDAALEHIAAARRLSQLLGGTDSDVKKYFFGLSDKDLIAVLDEYELKYGKSKRVYAENTLPLWRTGHKQMSGLVAERLFNLLPPQMPVDIKYEMVRKIWEKYSPSSDVAFLIGPDCDPSIASQEIERQLLDNVTKCKIPEPLENRFNWLSSGDVAIRQMLLNHFLDEERNLIAADARTRTHIILKHFEQKGQWTETIRQEYIIGKHKLELFFDSRASGIQKGRPVPTSQPQSSGCVVVVGAILTASMSACMLVSWLFE